jgi:hypothetical protein
MELKFPAMLKKAMLELGLDRRKAVERMGYRNITKGYRRLDAWLEGKDVPSSKEQVKVLAQALGLDEAKVIEAIKSDSKVVSDRRRWEEKVEAIS